jgi:hypothetical protein
MELKQAAQDLKDLRALRSQAQKRPDVTRYVIWGALSVCTVLAAALSIALAVSATRTPVKPTQVAAKPPTPAPAVSTPASSTAAIAQQIQAIPTRSPTEIELSRLHDALRALAAERDRLVNRVDQLERNVGDITASITKEREKPAPPPAAPAQQNVRTDNAIQPSRQSPAMPLPRPDSAQGQQLAMQNAPRGQQRAMDEDDEPPASRNNAPNHPGTFNRTTQNARQQIHPPPVPQAPPGANRLQYPQQQAMNSQSQFTTQSTDSTATRTEFAIDLGGEASIDGLRALWANIRGNHGAALEGLRPLVSVRDGVKPGTVELRLVAGPLANASAAARACATLHQKGVPCQTTIFDGQRLALR